VLQRRCYTCHKAPSDKQEDMELPFNYEAERKARGKLQRAVGAYERIVFENDPVARLSPNILLNFTRPEFSALLLGPLAKSAGGYGVAVKSSRMPTMRISKSSSGRFAAPRTVSIANRATACRASNRTRSTSAR
jgi:hypothetical protein